MNANVPEYSLLWSWQICFTTTNLACHYDKSKWLRVCSSNYSIALSFDIAIHTITAPSHTMISLLNWQINFQTCGLSSWKACLYNTAHVIWQAQVTVCAPHQLKYRISIAMEKTSLRHQAQRNIFVTLPISLHNTWRGIMTSSNVNRKQPSPTYDWHVVLHMSVPLSSQKNGHLFVTLTKELSNISLYDPLDLY